MKSRRLKLPLSLAALIILISCGGGSSSSNDNTSTTTPTTPEEEQNVEGTFRNVAKAVNPDVTSAEAAFQIKLSGDDFTVDIFGSGPTTSHGQYIHSGTRCPTKDDDTNKDGIIDSVEGIAAYGPRAIALDSDLETNGGIFPLTARYAYHQGGSWSKILANVGMTAFNLDGRILTIEGVPASQSLPSTVQGNKGDLPIACGVISRPEDQIPVP